MIENLNEEDLQRLRSEVECLVGRSIKSPKDFDFLSRQILGYTNEQISVSTLKRMWGYVAAKSNPSLFSLDVLSRMVGYLNWESFIGGQNSIASSRFFVKSKLMASALDVGEEVILTWCPGRIVKVMYRGNDEFEVVTSVNSKLEVGYTFVCHQFVVDEPCYLSNLCRKGFEPCNYVCGQTGGIKWKLAGE